MRVFRRCVLSGLLICVCATALAMEAAEQSPNSTPYSRGVDAYFSGDLTTAESSFAEAMGADPRDPRPFYFRALCRLREGRRAEARDDFLIAASLEARARGAYAVGNALERVQGKDRLALEQFRWHARPALATPGNPPSPKIDRADLAVYTDAGALRQAVSVPLDRLVEPVGLSELRESAVRQSLPATAMISDPAVGIEGTPAGANSAEDPFTDDPHSAAAGKIRSGKLMGIVGRALLQSAPVPSLEGLRDQLPSLPQPAATDAAGGADVDFGTTISDEPAAGDLFPESTAPASEPAAESTEDAPAADTAEADPFG